MPQNQLSSCIFAVQKNPQTQPTQPMNICKLHPNPKSLEKRPYQNNRQPCHQVAVPLACGGAFAHSTRLQGCAWLRLQGSHVQIIEPLPSTSTASLTNSSHENSSSKPSWQVLCWRVAKTYSNPRDLKEKDVLSTFRTHLAHPPTIMVHWNFG